MNNLKVPFLFLCIILTNQAVAQIYYPLSLSNKWSYHRSNAWYSGEPPPPIINDSVSIEVISDTLNINGHQYFTLSKNDIVGERFVRVDSSSIRYWNSNGGVDYLIFDLHGSIGDTTVSGYIRTILKQIDTLTFFNKSSIVRTYQIFKGLSFVQEARFSDIYGPLTEWTYNTDPPGPWPRFTMELIGCVIGGITSGTIVSVKKVASIFSGFKLSQNYPNPFNPSTTIEFSLPKTQYVQLDILDCLGRISETLISETLPSGKHQTQWNADKYSSGIYFYRLRADNNSDIKKLILLR